MRWILPRTAQAYTAMTLQTALKVPLQCYARSLRICPACNERIQWMLVPPIPKQCERERVGIHGAWNMCFAAPFTALIHQKTGRRITHSQYLIAE